MGARARTGPVVVEEAGPEKTMRTHRRRRRLAWALGWAGAAIVAVGNRGVRDLVLVNVLAERPARQLSTVTLLAAYLWWLNRTWTAPGAASSIECLNFRFCSNQPLR